MDYGDKDKENSIRIWGDFILTLNFTIYQLLNGSVVHICLFAAILGNAVTNVDFNLLLIFLPVFCDSYHSLALCAGVRDRYLVFKALTVQQYPLNTHALEQLSRDPGLLTLDKFYTIYDVVSFKWKPKQEPLPWYHGLPEPIETVCVLNTRFVQWRGFHALVC
jgi:hypothetical protein